MDIYFLIVYSTLCGSFFPLPLLANSMFHSPNACLILLFLFLFSYIHSFSVSVFHFASKIFVECK